MNERIKELATHAGLNTVEFNRGSSKLVFYGVDLEADGRFEQFAGLIVKECINKIDEVGYKSSNNISTEDTELFKSVLKTHFGVKE